MCSREQGFYQTGGTEMTAKQTPLFDLLRIHADDIHSAHGHNKSSTLLSQAADHIVALEAARDQLLDEWKQTDSRCVELMLERDQLRAELADKNVSVLYLDKMYQASENTITTLRSERDRLRAELVHARDRAANYGMVDLPQDINAALRVNGGTAMYDDISFDIGGKKKDKLLSRIAALEAERDEYKRIREHLVRALVRATGRSDEAVRESPLTCAVKAATERDQLRAEMNAIVGIHTCSPGCEKTALCRMTNERDRLREALTTIKDLPDLSGFGASHETIFQMRCIARAALKENNDGNA